MAAEHQPRTIHTPWGSFMPAVDLAPLLYMLVLYGLVYFLPFGLFETWTTGEDGPAEWLQFAAYAGACVCGLRVLCCGCVAASSARCRGSPGCCSRCFSFMWPPRRSAGGSGSMAGG